MDKATNQIDSPIKDISQFDTFRIDASSTNPGTLFRKNLPKNHEKTFRDHGSRILWDKPETNSKH